MPKLHFWHDSHVGKLLRDHVEYLVFVLVHFEEVVVEVYACLVRLPQLSLEEPLFVRTVDIHESRSRLAHRVKERKPTLFVLWKCSVLDRSFPLAVKEQTQLQMGQGEVAFWVASVLSWIHRGQERHKFSPCKPSEIEVAVAEFLLSLLVDQLDLKVVESGRVLEVAEELQVVVGP